MTWFLSCCVELRSVSLFTDAIQAEEQLDGHLDDGGYCCHGMSRGEVGDEHLTICEHEEFLSQCSQILHSKTIVLLFVVVVVMFVLHYQLFVLLYIVTCSVWIYHTEK